jgi:small subunit ribosomal protein S8
MQVNDPVGDLIARINNAQMRKKPKVSTPGSRLASACSRFSRTRASSAAYASVDHSDGRSEIEVELKYFDGQPVIREMSRVSKPGRRVYVAVRNLPRINNGLGVAILSTPKGVMADHDARDANVGGEVLCTVF